MARTTSSPASTSSTSCRRARAAPSPARCSGCCGARAPSPLLLAPLPAPRAAPAPLPRRFYHGADDLRRDPLVHDYDILDARNAAEAQNHPIFILRALMALPAHKPEINSRCHSVPLLATSGVAAHRRGCGGRSVRW